MDTIYPHCAGLDVHKDSIWACVRHLEGTRVRQEVREFGTTTRALLALSDWLASEKVTHVAMESTGVYWKPVYNLLEDLFTVWLVNPQHIKQVPGRKTDLKDCQWIAQLLQHGLLKPSFVPRRPQRELRDLTRQRTQLMADKARAANRIQKVLEDANIKLGSVASDVLGASGRDMIRGLIAGGQDSSQLAEMARRRLRAKIPQLREALEGRVREHHRFMLKMHLQQVEQIEAQVEEFDRRIQEVLDPFEREAVARLDTIPGLDVRTAQCVVAEIGTDMSRFPSAGHLCSWAGLSPGNHQSAGKRKGGKTTQGDHWLKAALTQAAWAASRTKKTYLGAQYHRLAGRRGKKKAIVAVAHSQLLSAYHMLKEKADYQELGPAYFNSIDKTRQVKYLVKRLESLGYRVSVQSDAA